MSSAATRNTGGLDPTCSHSVPVSPEAWRVVIHDHHEGYISWDQFLANRRRLEANRTNGEANLLPGPAREGLCLLQGMLLCVAGA